MKPKRLFHVWWNLLKMEVCLQFISRVMENPWHAAAVETLPDLHKDPFDLMMISQALTEPLRFMTHNRQLVDYAPSLVLLV